MAHSGGLGGCMGEGRGLRAAGKKVGQWAQGRWSNGTNCTRGVPCGFIVQLQDAPARHGL